MKRDYLNINTKVDHFDYRVMRGLSCWIINLIVDDIYKIY